MVSVFVHSVNVSMVGRRYEAHTAAPPATTRLYNCDGTNVVYSKRGVIWIIGNDRR